MQYKLLNFHKIISKFSSYIVEAFIALMIYQATKSFTWASLYMVAFNLLKLSFSALLYKTIQSRPQLFLLLRVIPFIIYSVSILLFETRFIVLGIILVLIFESLSSAINETSLDFILNYSSIYRGASATGISRMFEYLGIVLAILIGGAFLDNLDRWIVILIACTSYLISVIPLFLYYLEQRDKKGFNKEPISNATEKFQENPIKRHQQKVITKKILLRYYLSYCFLCVIEALLSVFSLYLFKVSQESYALVSYVQVAYYTFLALGSYFAGYWDEKHDLTNISIISCVIMAICVSVMPFAISNIWVEIILFMLTGFFYAIPNIFIYSRMITRTKVLGVSNTAISNRVQAMRSSQIFIFSFCSINPIMFVPTFFLISIFSIGCGFFIPANEEKTRKMLVDYLENNKMY